MVKRVTNKGKVIDIETLIAQNSDTPAMGNMRVNAKGDLLGKNGEVVQRNEDRVRAYYEGNPKSSTAKSSLKGAMPDQEPQQQTAMDPSVKTAQAQKTEADQSVMNPVEQPTDKKPVGYKEVEMPNGDIEMVPIYEDDWSDES
jgi:hypothetical protein